MKCIYLVFLMLFSVCIAGYAQKPVTADAQGIGLKETTYDFGKIPQGRPVTHNFEVTNTGKTPLMIENVEASCGCTTPEWKPDPVAPGASTTIKVGFNASSQGKFQKSITIYYGGDKVKALTISGEVYPTPTTSAPLNTSLSTLKQ